MHVEFYMKITTKVACVAGCLSKSRWPRQRERHRTKSAFGIFVHFLAVISAQNNYVKWPSSTYFGQRKLNGQLLFLSSLGIEPVISDLAWARLRPIGVLKRFTQLRDSKDIIYSVVLDVAIFIAKTSQYSTTQATNKEKRKKRRLEWRITRVRTSLRFDWSRMPLQKQTGKQTNKIKISPYLPQLFYITFKTSSKTPQFT